MLIWLVMLAAFGVSSLKKSGALDQMMSDFSKKKENQEDNVVFEQDEHGTPKKTKRPASGGGMNVKINAGHIGKGIGIAVLVVILGISNKKNLTKLPELQCENLNLNQLSVELDKVSPFNNSIYYKLPKEFFVKEFTIKGSMDIQGGEVLKIQPLATNNTFKVSSDWENPSFSGGWLPVYRNISSNGFSAEWNIPGMTTNFPKTWLSDTKHFSEYVKISFITPVDSYQKAFRSIKYALLFLLVPFLAIFICEIFTKIKIHPVQYCLLGLADVLFYLLLLSFSEHISFGFSYFFASFAVILATFFYSASIFKKLKWGIMIGCVQVISYILLLGTLQAEDYALLIGSIGLFVIVVLLMILTRNIDWYEINDTNK